MPTYDEVKRIRFGSYEELSRNYLDQHRPVILTDLVEDWPATKRWTPGFFREKYGKKIVETYNESFQEPGDTYLKPFGTMTFGNFIDLVEAGPTDTRLFLFNLFKIAPELRKDIILPEWSGFLSRLFLVSFFGGEGGSTTFHHDVDLPHVFHAVIHGSKEFVLFPPSQTNNLYPHPFTVRSYVDVQNPDYDRHPRFRDAQGYRCRVHAGETLVIPSGQWHQVYYPETSWGLAFRKYDKSKIPKALYNMLIQESIDKALCKISPQKWFQWKDRRSSLPQKPSKR